MLCKGEAWWAASSWDNTLLAATDVAVESWRGAQRGDHHGDEGATCRRALERRSLSRSGSVPGRCLLTFPPSSHRSSRAMLHASGIEPTAPAEAVAPAG